MRQRFGGAIVMCTSLLTLCGGPLAAPATAAIQNAGDSDDQGAASKGGGNVDQTVGYPMDAVHSAAKQALLTYGCESKGKKERPDYIECTRSRHMGVFVGSGGEKLTVKLSPVGNETRVVIKTGKGFAGRLGKKNWSTQVFDEMLKALRTS